MTDIRLINFLSEFLSERRLSLINTVLENRTHYATVLLEDIYQSQNASAVLRTCEILGIQNLHVIQKRNMYHYHPGIAMGAGKWIDIHKYCRELNSSEEAVKKLKAQQYRIVATVPSGNSITLDEFDLYKGKFAIVIGSELHGISSYLLEQADESITIPMYGFTESYNLSVSTAIILNNLIGRLHQTEIPWMLTEEEKLALKLRWLKSSVKKPELLIKKFRELYPVNQPSANS